MRIVEKPQVFYVCGPLMQWEGVSRYLQGVDGDAWQDSVLGEEDGEILVEFGGRLCYRSWKPGLNPNVTKVRSDSREYLHNILKSGHGSVLEHANYSFVLHDVSRVFTHELVRHRSGMAFSQESMRFVRLTDIPFWFPEWARKDEELMRRSVDLIQRMEDHQKWMAEHFNLDEKHRTCPTCGGRRVSFDGITQCSGCNGSGVVAVDFAEKKHKTSFMRRFAPDGVATGILATFNVRALRHVIYMRTALSAEEEIRLVMDGVAEEALKAIPNLMQDYSVNENREWIPEFVKV